MSRVWLEKITPTRAVHSYQQLIKKLFSANKKIKKGKIILKLNLSWTKFYPGCSTPPWQLEGVIRGLLDLGFSPKQIVPVENKTVVTDVYQGAKNHYWDKICKKYFKDS